MHTDCGQRFWRQLKATELEASKEHYKTRSLSRHDLLRRGADSLLSDLATSLAKKIWVQVGLIPSLCLTCGLHIPTLDKASLARTIPGFCTTPGLRVTVLDMAALAAKDD
jgi:hypothetical protein